jgi:hypothetical protein
MVDGLNPSPGFGPFFVDRPAGPVAAAMRYFGSGSANYNLSGTLTVTDGTHTASLTLIGQYVAAQFTSASNGHGGTLIGDPPVATTNTNPLVIAAASYHAA